MPGWPPQEHKRTVILMSPWPLTWPDASGRLWLNRLVTGMSTGAWKSRLMAGMSGWVPQVWEVKVNSAVSIQLSGFKLVQPSGIHPACLSCPSLRVTCHPHNCVSSLETVTYQAPTRASNREEIIAIISFNRECCALCPARGCRLVLGCQGAVEVPVGAAVGSLWGGGPRPQDGAAAVSPVLFAGSSPFAHSILAFSSSLCPVGSPLTFLTTGALGVNLLPQDADLCTPEPPSQVHKPF